jgi:hypothetical protein
MVVETTYAGRTWAWSSFLMVCPYSAEKRSRKCEKILATAVGWEVKEVVRTDDDAEDADDDDEEEEEEGAALDSFSFCCCC